LREYHSLLDRTEAVKLKVRKTNGNPRRTAMISRLSDELTAKFAAVSAVERDTAKWREQLNVAQENVRTVSEFLDAMKRFREEKSAVDQKIAALEAKNAKVQAQLNAESDDLATAKRETIEALAQKLRELIEGIQGKTPEEATSLIDIEYQALKEMAFRIVPTSTK
jgi:cysteinyl-tRNA synthetase